MAEKNLYLNSGIVINANSDALTEFVLRDKRAEELFSVKTDTLRDRNGTLKKIKILGYVFEIKNFENGIHLSGNDCFVDVDMKTTAAGGTKITVSVMAARREVFPVTANKVSEFLERLKTAAEAEFGLADDAITNAAVTTSDEVKEPEKKEKKERKKKEKKERKPRKRSGKYLTVLCVIMAVLLGFTVLYIGYELIPLVYNGASQESISGTSDAVTTDNALLLGVGMSRSEVERMFGTRGESCDGGTLYQSRELSSNGTPKIQVLIRYEKHIIKEVTYLDTDAASEYIEGDFTTKGVHPTELTLNSVSEAAGMTASMFRKYADEDENEIFEIHFGYVDPYANFSPAWRGQYVVTVNETTRNFSSRGWVVYNADALTAGSVNDGYIGNQYGDYDRYLEDKFTTDYFLVMKNGYSIGDVKSMFGSQPALYLDGSDTNGTMLYGFDCGDSVDGGETLRYRMSFGYDSANHFRMCSFVNMALFEQRGMLKGTQYDSVYEQMSYKEVRGLMGVVPTAIYIDDTCYTVCYGHYIENSSAENQFEMVVRVNILSDRVVEVFNNVAKAEAADKAANN